MVDPEPLEELLGRCERHLILNEFSEAERLSREVLQRTMYNPGEATGKPPGPRGCVSGVCPGSARALSRWAAAPRDVFHAVMSYMVRRCGG